MRPGPAPSLPLHPQAGHLPTLIPSSPEEETCTQASSWYNVLGLGWCLFTVPFRLSGGPMHP